MYTNKGLVNHCNNALKLRTKYMWGGILKPITSAYINSLRGIYGNQSGTGYSAPRYTELYNCAKQGGWYGCDCVGLIKSYYWSGKPNGGVGSPNSPYNKPMYKSMYPDVNATYMYNVAKKKGPIKGMPDIPGLIVYCRSSPHVGVYVGNGEVIECTLSSRGDGVVKTKLKDWKWEYWFECPYIDYNYLDDEPVTATKNVKYTCNARKEPKLSAQFVKKYFPGEAVEVEVESVSYDPKSKYTYIKIKNKDEWIVKSAL